MAAALVQFTLTALIIVAAAVALTRYADAIAEATRLGRLLVGSVFLAAATSLPELTIDLNAIWLNLPDMAVGDLLGSSLFNLLILAIADLSHRTRGAMFSHRAVAHALSGTVAITLTSIVGIALYLEPRVVSFTLGGLGAGSFALGIAYLLGIRLVYFDQRTAAAERELEELGQAAEPRVRLSGAILGYLAAAVVIFIAAPFLARAAETIAEKTGLGETFVGTTLIALSTSLPEFVTTVAAVRIGAVDLAIGNIFGSNALNMVLFLPLDLAYGGSLFAAASDTHLLTCFGVTIITSVVILGQLYRVERRVLFVEPDAALVIALVLGVLALVYYSR